MWDKIRESFNSSKGGKQSFKEEDDKAHVNKSSTRYVKDGSLVYSSETMYHCKDKVRGYMYKMAQDIKIFNLSLFYKRYFIINSQTDALYI